MECQCKALSYVKYLFFLKVSELLIVETVMNVNDVFDIGLCEIIFHSLLQNVAGHRALRPGCQAHGLWP